MEQGGRGGKNSSLEFLIVVVYRNDFFFNGKPEDEVYFMGGGVTGGL